MRSGVAAGVVSAGGHVLSDFRMRERVLSEVASSKLSETALKHDRRVLGHGPRSKVKTSSWGRSNSYCLEMLEAESPPARRVDFDGRGRYTRLSRVFDCTHRKSIRIFGSNPLPE
jgi:hypothetical protein